MKILIYTIKTYDDMIIAMIILSIKNEPYKVLFSMFYLWTFIILDKMGSFNIQ